MTLRLRRAEPEDVDFLVELANHEEVEPFMSARRARDAEGIRAEVERSLREPREVGTFLIEVDDGDGDGWRRAGSLEFAVRNRRSRIAHLGGLALHPDFRGRRLADEAARRFQRHLLFDLGYHRLELECYAFNERAIRHAERAGYVREGRRRSAYWRHGEWVDGVLYGLVREDLEGIALLLDHVSRFNAGVASGDFGPMLELFADDAEMAFEGVAVGPFTGRDAIAAAYRERPPDDGLELLDAREEGGLVVAAYAWRADPSSRAGELRLTPDAGRIRRLVVTFD